MVAPGIFCPVLYFPLWLSTYKGRGRRSKLQPRRKRTGCGSLLAIRREFGKSVGLLTGKTHIEPNKRVTSDSTGTSLVTIFHYLCNEPSTLVIKPASKENSGPADPTPEIYYELRVLGLRPLPTVYPFPPNLRTCIARVARVPHQ